MAYMKTPVPIPKSAIIVKVSGKKYVYCVDEKIYKKDKKYNSDKRKCVGKVIENTNTMYPNEYFQIYFPDEYNEMPEVHLESDKMIHSDCLKLGFTGVFFELAENLRLKSMLSRHFGSDEYDNIETTNMILNYAAKVVATQNGTISSYPFFARENVMLDGKIASESTLCNVFKSIKKSQIQSFTKDRINFNKDKSGVLLSCDGSNVATDATDIEIAEMGHNKSGEEENQVAFTLVTNQNNYRPLMLEEYKGSTHDANALSPIMKLLKEYGVNNITYILDRGYFSEKIMRRILRENNNFLMMTKNCKFIKDVYDKYYDEIISYENFDSELDMHHFTYVGKLFKSYDKSIYFHMFFNPESRQNQEKSLKKIISENSKELNKLINFKLTDEEIEKYADKFNLVFENGRLVTFSVNKEYIEKELKYSGFFTILASNITEACNAYTKYRNRDYTEKLFAMLKTNEELEVLRSHDEDHLIGKVFSLFIGLIIRNEIFIKTKELRKASKDKSAYTTTQCLRELSCIEAVKLPTKKYQNIRAYTKKQNNIIKALGMTLKDVEKPLKMLNKRF